MKHGRKDRETERQREGEPFASLRPSVPPSPRLSSFAVILIPNFALQSLLRHIPERRSARIALLPDKTPRARITECTAAALAGGAEVGMTPTQAQARCDGLEIVLRSEAAERSARAALLDCAGGFAPYVEDTGPGIATLELKTARVAPAELAESMRARLARLHLDARIGFAQNADLALLAAQSAHDPPGWRVVQDPDELHALALQSLRFTPRMIEILFRWGVTDLGGFVALGREQLAERLGPEVLPLFAQATGAIERPLKCLPPAQSYEEAVEFEHEIETLEPLLFILRRLLEQIIVRLESTYLVAARLTLRLGFSHRPAYERAFKIPAPTAKVDVLFRALHTHLERFTAEEPIISLALAAEPCRPPRQQFGLFESALRDPNQFYETLARLAALLGNDRVGFPELEDTHRPDAFHLRETAPPHSPSHNPSHSPAPSLPDPNPNLPSPESPSSHAAIAGGHATLAGVPRKSCQNSRNSRNPPAPTATLVKNIPPNPSRNSRNSRNSQTATSAAHNLPRPESDAACRNSLREAPIVLKPVILSEAEAGEGGRSGVEGSPISLGYRTLRSPAAAITPKSAALSADAAPLDPQTLLEIVATAFQNSRNSETTSAASGANTPNPSHNSRNSPSPALTLRRFRPPLPAHVELNAAREPIALTSAALRGRATAAQGPMEISGEWWGDRQWSRLEWDLELADGLLCRIYEDTTEPRRWFVEGVYD